MVEAGFEEENHPACREGRCTDPIDAGGLGVVHLHPINELVLAFYERCRRLTPAIALPLSDLAWHPDPDMLAEELQVLTLALGPMAEPPPRCPQEGCRQTLILADGRWLCRACRWPER